MKINIGQITNHNHWLAISRAHLLQKCMLLKLIVVIKKLFFENQSPTNDNSFYVKTKMLLGDKILNIF